MYNCIAEVLHGIWSLVVNHREYPIIPKGGEDMISGANNASGNILQNRAIPNTAPDRLLSRVCMFTIMLLYTATITVSLFRMQSHHNSGGSERCKRG